jgi:hypothetical protein
MTKAMMMNTRPGQGPSAATKGGTSFAEVGFRDHRNCTGREEIDRSEVGEFFGDHFVIAKRPVGPEDNAVRCRNSR